MSIHCLTIIYYSIKNKIENIYLKCECECVCVLDSRKKIFYMYIYNTNMYPMLGLDRVG
jgi:hypothetical protein